MKAIFNQFTANDHPSCLTFSASAKKEISTTCVCMFMLACMYLFNLFVIYLVFCMFFNLNAAADSSSRICTYNFVFVLYICLLRLFCCLINDAL